MLLEIQNVRQSFRVGFWMKQVEVLHDVSFQLAERSIHGFLGANGAGKTTLIQLIVGLRKPTSGRVLLRGHEATTREARARIGYLPERPYFHDHLTGEGLLKYFGTLSGMKRAHVASRIPQVLATVGMSHAGKLELRRYSKGMLQRIGIAQAILHEPEFLVLDEPMSGLDPLRRKEIRELIQQLAGDGHTVFFSSHVIPDVEALCDQVVLIQKGNLVGCGPINQMLSSETHQTEIAFSGLDTDRVARLPGLSQPRQTADGTRALVDGQESLDRALRAILEGGGKILWATPVRPSLESFFENSERGKF